MNSPGSVRLGAQRPRVELIPDAYTRESGEEAIQLAASAGLILDPWQEYVMRGSLGEDEANRWVASHVGLIVPRQQGKGSILEARELAGLFLFKEELILHSAQHAKTSNNAFTRIMQLIQSTPDLDRQVLKVMTAHGDEGVYLRSGAALRFMARNGGSGRGFSADLIVLDEAYDLKQHEVAAMLPTMAARPNPQLWFTSSAGMPNSEVLMGVRERGMNPASKGFAYFEWSAPDDADPNDIETILIANPGFGRRLSEEHVEAERDALGPDEFLRERCGVWEKLGGESFIPETRWASCRDDVIAEMVVNGEVVEQKLSRVALGVDVPPDRSSASVCVAGLREDGSLFVELIMRREGTDWVAGALRELLDERGRIPIVADGMSAIASLALDFRRERVRILYPSRDVYRKACGVFYDKVMQQGIRHGGQPDLDAAVNAAKPSSATEKLWVWTGGKSGVDVSPLVAATLAVHGSLNRPDKTEKTAKRRAVFA
jgi:hypothetical protein